MLKDVFIKNGETDLRAETESQQQNCEGNDAQRLHAGGDGGSFSLSGGGTVNEREAQVGLL